MTPGAEVATALHGYLACRHDAGSTTALPLLLLVPEADAPDWLATPMPWQCEVKSSNDSGQAGFDLFSLDVWQCTPSPCFVDAGHLAALVAFTQESWALLGLELAEQHEAAQLLIAPLCEGFASPLCPPGEATCLLRAADSIDWATVDAVVALRNARGGGAEAAAAAGRDALSRLGPSLLQRALEASSAHSSSSEASNEWLEQLVSAGSGSVRGLLVVATYSMRPYMLKRVWCQCLAGKERVACPSRGREKGLPMDPPPLLDFYRDRYGIADLDPGQCILEAAEGACFKPYSCPGHFHTPRLSVRLCEEGCIDGAPEAVQMRVGSTSASSAQPCKEVSEAGDDQPGPIRLLPELLIAYPLPAKVQETLRYLPLLCRKMLRHQKLTALRRCTYCLIQASDLPAQRVLQARPFVKDVYGSTPRHALRLEARLLDTLRSERFSCVELAAMHTSPVMPSHVDVEWMLEVATTTSGACEPYELGRVAWIGDAALLFIAVTSVLLGCRDIDLQGLRNSASSLVSNQCLACLAESPPLRLHEFLVTLPFSSRLTAASAKASAQRTSKKSLCRFA
mmetsp:Transcript_123924/g.396130  ORF Transcript_123924/g.396130 Transcript_123924/m.396130 type:complete len:567 (+) Transcript_123924:98-1798(+)